VVPPGGKRHLLVALNPAALATKPSSILKHRYFQEVVARFNLSRLACCAGSADRCSCSLLLFVVVVVGGV